MFIANIKWQQHYYEVENGITAIWSGPDFCSKKDLLKQVYPTEKKKMFKQIEKFSMRN